MKYLFYFYSDCFERFAFRFEDYTGDALHEQCSIYEKGQS
jgi:hypothetical protein